MNLTIKRVADLVGLTPRTLRYYESVGLLPAPERTSGNYRVYSAADLVDLVRIKRLTAMGFSLNQVFEIIDDPASEASVAALRSLAAELDQQMTELQAKRAAVTQVLQTNRPLDVVEDFAAVLQRHWELFPDEEEAARDKMRVDLIAALGDERDAERIRELLAQIDQNREDPAIVRLADLDARFALLGPDSAESEIA